MPFVKLVKNKAYFKRYQVQYRRRREGKTDYRARRGMVLQDKTKYGAPKYRLVVRMTNKDIVAQIVHAKVDGDSVLTAAYSHELPRYGLKVGLTNYAAAYSTGLLVARRALDKLNIAKDFDGNKNVTGAFAEVRTKDSEAEGEGRFPFKAILDVGLARTTTGARIFGVMKGAVDGGIAVPHKANRFPGYNKESSNYDAKVHRARIFGAHVAEWYQQVQEDKKENPDEKNFQFNKFAKEGIKADAASMEAMYKKVHDAIRANPKAQTKAKSTNKAHKKYNIKSLTYLERSNAAKKKLTALRKAVQAAQ